MTSQLTVVEKERLLKLAKSFRVESKNVALPPISAVERGEHLSLSFAQQRLWFMAQQMEGVSRAYHIFNCWRLKGQLDRSALRRALDRIVARHESLRTTFVSIEGEPAQRFTPAEESRFHLVEHGLDEVSDPRAKLESLVREEAAAGFDLEKGPLIRGRLMQSGQDEHALLITMHHIVSDGWSMGVFIRELSALYGAFVRAEADPLPELEVQYADYAIWQRKWMEGEILRNQGEYWERTLARAPALLELPTDHARPAKQDYTGELVKVVLDEELTRGLKELSKKHGTTLYMTLLAGWGALLARLSGQDDVVIGTPVANRGRMEIEGLIGFFVNLLALRLDVSGSPSVGDLLKRVKEQTLSAQQNQDISFEQVVEIARPVRSPAQSPLFQVGFSWQNAPAGAGTTTFSGLEVRPLPSASHRVAKLDLTLLLGEAGERIVGGLEYATALFEQSTVERYLGYLRALLEGMVADSAQAVDGLPLLAEAEQRQIVYEWNETQREYSREKLVHELFEDQVDKSPEAVAVVFEDTTLSYGELNRRANQLAHYLRGLGVVPDARVGICVERSLEMIVGLLGVLKAGGAYVPLDPDYPVERLQYMVTDSEPVAVLTRGQKPMLFAGGQGPAVLDLGQEKGAWRAEAESNPDVGQVGLRRQHLAYVIYTSGSTGLAKGVMVEHQQLVNYVAAISEKLELGQGWAYGLVSTFAADLGNTVLFPSLLRRGKLHVLAAQESMDGERLGRYCLERGIDCVKITPTHFQALLGEGGEQERIPSKCVVFGGETLTKELVARVRTLRSGCRIYNHYGPTECTVGALSDEVAAGNGAGSKGAVALGRPLGNMRVYVLDSRRKEVPAGVVGEIYIGGGGVARGYLNRAEQTAERFVSDPFVVDGQERMYKTGDLGRWKVDGRIEFLGRNDFQVKIRGYRIELGEIEARLMEHDGVREAIVIAREDTIGDRRLVAYYKGAEANGGGSEGIGAEELRRHLLAKLPEYMAPAAYVRLEKLPLTPNGKVDRRALPMPEGDAYGARSYEEPQGEIETALAGIWVELLKLERVGRHDNFFELGGNSLLLVRVIARMRRAGWQVDLQTLFATPVLAELAVAIRPQIDTIEVPPNRIPPGCEAITPEMLPLARLTAEEIERIVEAVPGGAANVQDIYPLAPLQEGILFHHLMGGESDPYILGSLYSFDSRERLGNYLEAMQSVIDRHDTLRTGVVWEGLSEPAQVVWRKAVLPVEEVTLEAGAGDGAMQLYSRYNPRSYRIDVRQAPLLRVAIAHDEEKGRWLMMLLRHHLAGDHVTHEVMREEIQAYLLGQGDRLTAPLPFRNLVAQARLGISQEEHEAFFRRLLGDVEEPTAPFGLLNVQGDGTGIGQAQMKVETQLARRIRERARKLGVSPASLCHVAWAQVVARTSGREDVVFGTVLFGRMQGGEGADRALGLFMNTLPVRIRVGEEGAEESVRGAHKQLAELMRHEHASLALAQRCSAVPAPTPLFSVLLNYRHSAGAAQTRSEEKARAWEGIQGLYMEARTNYPVTLNFDDLGEGFWMHAQVEASVDANRVCQYMRTALESLVEALESEPMRPVRTLEVVPEAERRQVVNEWNETQTEYPRGKLMHELFEDQVEKTPEAVAVVFEDTSLSYGELNRRANQLGHHLRELGVGPDERVAICVERSLEMMVGLLGVMKAGGAYIPLDPAYPLERLQYMLEDGEPAVLLTQGRWQELFSGVSEKLPALDLDEAAPAWRQQPETNPEWNASGGGSEHLAYLIYTSGSTGVPKGAMVEQGGMVNHLYAKIGDLQLSGQDVVAQTASQCFDISVWQFLAALIVGGKVLIVGEEEVHDPEGLLGILDRRGVTVWETVPSMLEAMVGEGRGSGVRLESMRWVVVTGEACPVGLCRRWKSIHPAIAMMNAYGPTECSDDVTHYAIEEGWSGEETKHLAIGRPVMNMQVYVLDSRGEAAPVGVSGELYIGGEGVGRGYWNRAELTAERFVADGYGRLEGGRLYRTGDVARWGRDRNLEFMGRIDHQIKIRGYRIESGEIEARLTEHDGVREAVVIAREDTVGDRRLVAYYKGAEANGGGSEGIGAEELRRHLLAKLPEYMAPAAYVRLEKLPLTPNGKVDRKALPAPETDAYAMSRYEEPEGETERALAEIWVELLKLERVGRRDNFFELGGHSLLVVRVISRLRKVLNVEVTIRDVFDHPVLADLATAVRGATQATLPSITPAQRGEQIPLSFAQQRLWLLAQMGASEAYHIFYGLRLKGQLDGWALRRALDRIVARHEGLRTTFVSIEGEPGQRMTPTEESRFHLVEQDLSKQIGTQGKAQEELDHLVREEAAAGFDLERGPLIRGRLIRMGEEEHALLITMHHIVSDGWSMGVFIKELSVLYGTFVRGEADPLPEMEVQYADYAVWQRKWVEGEILRNQGEYWERTLAGAPALLELPADHPRPAEQEYAGGWARVTLDEDLTRGLKELSKKHGTTLYMTLMAGWGALLARLSGQEDIVIGTPVANRGRMEIEGLIGFFVNTLALRLDVSGSPSVGDLLKRVKEQTLSAQQNQDIPFEQVVEIARPVRTLAHTPLFQVMFAWQQNIGGGGLALPGLELGPLGSAAHVVAKFDLTLSLRDAGERIVGGFDYATGLFERATMERYLGYLGALLEGMVAEETQAVDRLQLLPEAERRQIVNEWNATEAEYPREKLVHQLFEEQVEKTPEAVAVVFEDTSLSYGELNREANRLAHYLRGLGVKLDIRVGICVERSLEMVVGLLAVLKAGGAYVPLDPAYPVERLEFMLEDSAPAVLLTQRDLQSLFPKLHEDLAVIDLKDDLEWKEKSETNPNRSDVGLGAENLAYLIYTSGSTGAPKGVMVEHRQLSNYLVWADEEYYREAGSGSPAVHSIGFDGLITTLFGPIIAGQRLTLLSKGTEMESIAQLCSSDSSPYTLVKVTPSHLKLLNGMIPSDSRKAPTRALMIGGEALVPADVDFWQERFPEVRLINHFGPTETTVGCCTFEIARRVGESSSIPIGRPTRNMRMYILDKQGEPAPVGVAGEIYIGGAQVTRGYRKRPELTAERYVLDPHTREAGARMYRTGDLGRWQADGKIEFLGRNDFQVKIRGYRIELGEIEAQLAAHEAIQDAVVIACEDATGDKRLVAYYTSAEENGDGGEGIGAEQLRRHLLARLPEYMMPAAYVRLEKLPLTLNGKLDRKALPAPEGSAYATRGYEEPIGDLEKALAVIWAETLKLERVGRQDNFFELGGNSLLVVRVIARMRQAGWQVDVRAMFATRTLGELAAVCPEVKVIEVPPNRIPFGSESITPEMLPLARLTAEEIERIVDVVPGGAANVQDIYPLAPLQEGILFHHLMGGDSDPYVVGGLYSFDSRERLESYLEAMQLVIDRHDILRTGVVWEGLSEPMQVVWRKAVLPVEEVTLKAGDGDGAGQLRARYNPRSYQMDVRQAPLLRVAIAHDEEKGRWLMMLLRHHLAGDQITQKATREEIQAYLLGQGDRLTAPLPFRNLVAQARLGISQEEHEAFFRRLLGDVEEPTAPFGLLNVQGDGTGIGQARMKVEEGLARRIRERARKLGVSPASLCHVAWAQVVARTSGRKDVVFGTVLFGRMQGGQGADRAMGLFMNTLPVRIRVGKEGAEESVRGAHKQLAELLRHEHASLALAQRCSAVPAPTPLFSSLLNYVNNPGQARSEEKARAWEGIEDLYGEARTNYPLTMNFDDLGEGFRMYALMDASVDANRVCQYMHTALESLVEALESEPTRPMCALEVAPEAERRQVVYEWNETQTEYPREKLVHELFEEQVEKTPDGVAVVFEDANLSYGELNRRANQLAHYLRELGVEPDARVGICVARGLEMIVGLLAVWKAGGAYVPLDPAYPIERLSYMLEHSAPAALLTERHLQGQFDRISESLPVIDLTGAVSQWSARPDTNTDRVAIGVKPEHLAYMIYTSGSTGLSKGVMVCHQSVVNLFFGLRSSVYSTPNAAGCLRVSVNGSLAFDTSVKQIIQLLDGHTLDIIPEAVRRDGEGLLRFVRDRNIEALDCTPSQLSLLLEAGLVRENSDSYLERLSLDAGLLSENAASTGLVLVGGESIEKTTWVTLAASQIRFFNVYGPTECTVDASVREVRSGLEPSIGGPIANTALYVLDTDLNPVPRGAPGELYIGGEGIARGYLNDPETTAQKFIANPFSSARGLRLYRTGDRVRHLSDGNLAFLGRTDDQVKVRGFRIEPNEIASVLEQHPAVRKAAVGLHTDHDDPRLVAYVVLDPMRSPSIAGRQRYKLPNNLAVVHLNRNETDFLYEEMFEIQAYFKHGISIRDGDCVFDVGANIGLFSLAAHLRARNVRIYAFEPSPLVFDLLKTNMQLYSVDTRLYSVGLSRERRSMLLTFYPKFSFLSGVYADREEDKEVVRSFVRKHEANINEGPDSELLEELLEDRFESREIEVSLVTLSDMLRENNVGRIDLLKINVEKSEMDVLAGIEEQDWPKIRQIAMEVHDIDGRLNSIVELLQRHDYEISVEQDWQLEESTRTNFYIYARRAVEDLDMERASQTFLVDQLVTAQELRAFLAKRLPEYMVPAAYVHLDALPLTPNGKLDRKRLPAPEGDAYAAAGYKPPVGEIETALVEIWQKALQLDQVGRHDNFFELGGHSLLALRVVTLLEQLDINITIIDLFSYTTIESLARKIELVDKRTSADSAICLRKGGAERPLFLTHPSIYADYGRFLAPLLDPGIPVYSLPARPLSETPDRTIEGMAMRMAQMIRSVQPEGPYRIAGFSGGGPLAYEIAAQLIGADQKVDFLGLLDAHYLGDVNGDTSAIRKALDWFELSDTERVLRSIEGARARPGSYSRRVTQAVVDELRLSAPTMDFATFLRKCQDMSVLNELYDHFTATQLHQTLARNSTNHLANMEYRASPLSIPVHFFAATTPEPGRENNKPSVQGWKSVVPPRLLRIIPIEGSHTTIMGSPSVGQVLSNTIRDAAEDSGEIPERSYAPLVGLQSGRQSIAPHFWVPGAGAGVTNFAELVGCMNRTIPVYGIQPRGLEGELVPHSTVQAAAEFYVRAINDIYPRGPVRLLGHSFGGWVAFRMAHLLLESGRTVASLTVLDKEAPDRGDSAVREYSHTDTIMNWIDSLELVLGYPLGIGRTDIEWRSEAFQRELLHRRLVTAGLMPSRSDPDVLRGPLRAFAASIRARYTPETPYLGPLKLVLVDDPRLDQASNRQYHEEATEDWKRCAPNLVCVHGPGNHLTMLKSPHVQALANLIQDDLQ